MLITPPAADTGTPLPDRKEPASETSGVCWGTNERLTCRVNGSSVKVPVVAPTRAALATIHSSVQVVIRTGYAANGDVAPLVYQASEKACSIARGAGDGGSQVPTSDGKCWIAAWPSSGMDARQYGVKCDNITENQPAIQAMVNAMSEASVGRGILPSGLCRITGEILFKSDSATLEGSGLFSTHIVQHALNAKIFNVPTSNIRITGMSLDYSGPPKAGAVAIYTSGANNEFDHLYIRRADIGAEFLNMAGGFLHHLQIWDYANVGVFIHNASDIYINNFILNANTSAGANGGIRLQDRAEAIVVSDGEILAGVHSITMDAASNTVGHRPAFNRFSNVYADSSTQEGGYFTNAADTEFVGGWFSGGRSGSGYAGLLLNVTSGFRFTSTMFFNNGGNGASVMSGSVRTAFVNCKYSQNSVIAGTGVASGIEFQAGTTDFIVTGSTLSNDGYPNTQKYGVFVSNGASDRYIISGNLVSGNQTAGIFDGGTGSNKSVTANY